MPTLLAFLSSGCATCAEFWETLAQPLLSDRCPDRDRHSRTRPRAARPAALPRARRRASRHVLAGMGRLRRPRVAYFVLVDGTIAGEGVATTWPALSSLVNDAIEDQLDMHAPTRAETIEATLAAAGIGPDHPSLRPETLPVQPRGGPR